MSARIRQSEIFFAPPPPGGAIKLQVNCLVVTVKIMFTWYNNVVATNTGFICGPRNSILTILGVGECTIAGAGPHHGYR